ncbi:MAG TPA: ABC transporter ATP-binding protein [Terriglobia bacterium]|nr:ABC transporter ATP-binding protein [Terriglobia bacterium]
MNSPSSAKPLVSVQGLTRRFGQVTAVDGLTLEVMEGEIFGLIGPDGAGKTTSMRLLLGILRPDAGSGHVGGCDLIRDTESVTTLTGYVSQRFSLYEELSVEENLTLFADLYGVAESERAPRLERLMQFSRLGPFRDRLARNLSGGMKQKLALSCALIHTPRLLLLDEPTTGVDPLSRRDLWRLLFDLWQEGVTIIVSTPYMDEAERCSRVGFLSGGKLIRTGTPEELRGQFRGTILEVFAERRFEARAALAGIEAVEDVNLFGEGLHATFRNTDATQAERRAREALANERIGVRSIMAVEPTIEDVYFQLTRDPSRQL